MRLSILIILCSSIGTFAQEPLELPEIEGKIKTATNPKGWETYVGSPDIVAGEGIWNNEKYTLDHITGDHAGESMVWMMCVRPSGYEGMQTTVTGLKIGKLYSVSVKWQQCAMMLDDERMYWGGDLLMIVNGVEHIFKSEGVHDNWQTATVEFEATSKSAVVVVQMYNPDYDKKSKWGGCIVVDDADTCVNCPAAEVAKAKREAGG